MSEMMSQSGGVDSLLSSKGRSVPAYLSDDLAGRFERVRLDVVCPFCMGEKGGDALACFTCYGARLTEIGGDDLAVLEARERVLLAQRRAGDDVAPEVGSVEEGRASPVEVSRAPARLTLSRFMIFALVVWAAMLSVVLVALWVARSGSGRPSVVVISQPPRVVDLAGSASAEPDLGDADRRTAALLFVKTLYDVDPETRRADVLAALKMMTAEAAAKVSRGLKASGALEQERRLGLRVWWQRESVEFDPQDPTTVRLRGRRVIERAGRPDEYDPLQITLKLVVDPKGRTLENQKTGYLIGGVRVDAVQE